MSETVTETPDLRTALKTLEPHIDYQFYREEIREMLREDDELIAYKLRYLEQLLVRVAGDWGLMTSRMNHVKTRHGIHDILHVYNYDFEIGKDGITSFAHALAVGLLKFKEEECSTNQN
jgi:hypothetical protein